MELEVWKDIKGYEGIYQISNTGLIKSAFWGNHFAGKYNFKTIIRGSRSKNGYLGVALRNINGTPTKRMLVHRLVALHFIKNPKNLPFVDHIDTNPSNNSANNLRWVDASGNARNKISYGRMCDANKRNKRPGDLSPRAKRIAQIKNGKVIAIYGSVSSASLKSGISYRRIIHCANGEQSNTDGYVWIYL